MSTATYGAESGVEYAQTSLLQAGRGAGADEAVGQKLVDEEGVWCEGSVSEPLDEDGTPCLDPYDPEKADRVVAKWAEEHTGLMD